MKTDNLKKIIKKQEGFTLVEIIAVLVVLGVLAAVAVPKYMDLQDDARKKAAWGGIAECKSALNIAYAKEYLRANGGEVDLSDVVVEAFAVPDGGTTFTTGSTVTYGDVTVKVNFDTTTVTIEPSSVMGVSFTYVPTDYQDEGGTQRNTWTMP